MVEKRAFACFFTWIQRLAPFDLATSAYQNALYLGMRRWVG